MIQSLFGGHVGEPRWRSVNASRAGGALARAGWTYGACGSDACRAGRSGNACRAGDACRASDTRRSCGSDACRAGDARWSGDTCGSNTCGSDASRTCWSRNACRAFNSGRARDTCGSDANGACGSINARRAFNACRTCHACRTTGRTSSAGDPSGARVTNK